MFATCCLWNSSWPSCGRTAEAVNIWERGEAVVLIEIRLCLEASVIKINFNGVLFEPQNCGYGFRVKRHKAK
jgi:hypothetical protein